MKAVIEALKHVKRGTRATFIEKKTNGEEKTDDQKAASLSEIWILS